MQCVVRFDELYNPSALVERVTQTYNIIRERTKVVTDNIVKLDVILDIVKENIGKRILIISKNGVFASKVTEYLNANIKYEGKSIMTNGEIFQTGTSILQYDYCETIITIWKEYRLMTKTENLKYINQELKSDSL